MAIVLSPESPLRIELERWNVPYVYHELPRMVYRARVRPDGVVSVGETMDSLFGGHPGSAEAWTSGCQRIVNDEREYQRALEEGFRETQLEALEYHEKRERARGEAAANRAYTDRNMSEAAKAEAAEAEAATIEHVAEVPATPIRRRGRPRKVVA